MKKNKIILLICFFISFAGCTNKNIIQEKNDEEEFVDEVNDYQGKIKEIKFLNRDHLFLLTLDDEEQILVNSNGKIENINQLKSEYLSVTYDYSSSGTKDEYSGLIYDLFGNDVSSRFVKDKHHEKILGVCSTDKKDVVCILKNNESPTSTEYVLNGYDEDGKQLFSISSEDSNIKQKNYSEYFKDIVSVSSSGDCICNVNYSLAKTEGLFAINVLTGEIVESDTFFSEGYGVVTKMNNQRIVDIHGNIIRNLNEYDLGDIHNYNNGLFFSNNTKCFYDKDFNKKIDLSQYEIAHWSGENENDYTFEDGYCGIEVFNENKTSFYGLIDVNGHWIIELTDDLDCRPKVKRINDSFLQINRTGYDYYNIDTQEYGVFPFELKETKNVLYDGRYYYLTKSGYFKMFDVSSRENIEINIVE